MPPAAAASSSSSSTTVTSPNLAERLMRRPAPAALQSPVPQQNYTMKDFSMLRTAQAALAKAPIR
jgi:hypothetical protein